MSDLARIIHKAVTDPAFRAAFLADPVSSLAVRGLVVSDEEFAALTDVIDLLHQPSEGLLARLKSAESVLYWLDEGEPRTESTEP